MASPVAACLDAEVLHAVFFQASLGLKTPLFSAVLAACGVVLFVYCYFNSLFSQDASVYVPRIDQQPQRRQRL